MSQEKNDPTGDVARLMWVLKSGATPMSRIYSTMKHLGSKKSGGEIEKMVKGMVSTGILCSSPHPFRENESFYSISAEAVEKV